MTAPPDGGGGASRGRRLAPDAGERTQQARGVGQGGAGMRRTALCPCEHPGDEAASRGPPCRDPARSSGRTGPGRRGPAGSPGQARLQDQSLCDQLPRPRRHPGGEGERAGGDGRLQGGRHGPCPLRPRRGGACGAQVRPGGRDDAVGAVRGKCGGARRTGSGSTQRR